jgi:hypothetical protein
VMVTMGDNLVGVLVSCWTDDGGWRWWYGVVVVRWCGEDGELMWWSSCVEGQGVLEVRRLGSSGEVLMAFWSDMLRSVAISVRLISCAFSFSWYLILWSF